MGGERGGGINFLALPEDCITDVLSFTSPLDACRLSTVSSNFRDLVDSDTAWERFLPSDYHSIIAQSSDSSLLNRCSSKKQLYLSLCDHPIIIEDGRMSFALEKLSGKKCYMISASNLKIIWGDTPTYWRWNYHPDSRFAEVAELISVCWFEISGRIKTHMLSPSTKYGAYFVFQSRGAYGFEYACAEVTVGLVGSEGHKHAVYLDVERGQRRRYQLARRRIGLFNRSRLFGLQAFVPEGEIEYLKKREDGWFEVELGEFFNKEEGEAGELEMSILEVKGGHWKGGILVQGIEIRPKLGN